MGKITELRSYDGAQEKIDRLGLSTLVEEIKAIITSFPLLVEEKKNGNSGAVVREMMDSAFQRRKGWTKTQSGDIDWRKCKIINGTRVCVGVEVQFSARSDLIIIDIIHLRKQIVLGAIDLGILVLPSDKLSYYLTDRAPRMSDGKRHVEESKTEDLPLILIAVEHDGAGPPLPKKKTRQGKLG